MADGNVSQQQPQEQQQQQQQQQQRHHQGRDRHHHGNGATPKRRTVLIAMDGSAHSFYAFDSALATDPTIMPRLLEKEEEEVNNIVLKIKGKLNTTGVRGRLIRLSGEPGPTIVASANQNAADFIVTGSRGMGTIRRTLIGSVSDYILHHATCPVMVCRKKNIQTS